MLQKINMIKREDALLMMLALAGLYVALNMGLNAAPAVDYDRSIWETDYKAALEKAKVSGKPILLKFTGSDWCPPCIAMDREVFSQDAFANFAKEELILVLLDFPRKSEQAVAMKEQNQELAAEYKVMGFPTYVVLNSDGQILSRHTGYRPGGVEGFIEFVHFATGESVDQT